MNINKNLQNRIKGWLSKKFVVSMTENNGKIKTDPKPVELSEGALLFIGTACVVASVLLLGFPYILFPQLYVPKADPSMGYVAPNTPATWAIFIIALILLVVGIFTIIKLAYKQKESRMFRRSLGGFFF